MLIMYYTSEVEGEKYQLQLIKRGSDKKNKLTIKKHQENIDLGEIYSPEGSIFLNLQGSKTQYFTGKYLNCLKIPYLVRPLKLYYPIFIGEGGGGGKPFEKEEEVI